MPHLQAPVINEILPNHFLSFFQQASEKGDFRALQSIIRLAVEFTRGFQKTIEDPAALGPFKSMLDMIF